jgi:hypothetical protein
MAEEKAPTKAEHHAPKPLRMPTKNTPPGHQMLDEETKAAFEWNEPVPEEIRKAFEK